MMEKQNSSHIIILIFRLSVLYVNAGTQGTEKANLIKIPIIC